MSEKSQTNPTFTPPTSTNYNKTTTFSQGLLSVAEAAKLLGKPAMTVTRWCKSGELPAIPKPYGTSITYRISPAAIELKRIELGEKQNNPKHIPQASIEHSSLIDSWLKALGTGTLTGKKYSPVTISDYEAFVRPFVEEYKAVSSNHLQAALGKCNGYAQRFKLYKAILCFAKFLNRQGQLPESFFTEVKPFFPKRDTAPKRTTVDEESFLKLLGECKKPLHRALIILLATTGLRASELCNLQLSDVQFDKQTLTAKNRKAGKTTTLGLNPSALEALKVYRDSLPKWIESPYLFVSEIGHPLTRSAVGHRLRNLSLRTGIPVHAHALRRAFVTLNANKGRPLQMLQIACGHSSIKTTMDYCRTSEQEVVDAMKGW